ncbi:MAG TPA: hypothetical protein VJQ59_16915 [Candidatus Sulfotelmatobacter sp.]|nr:hypothetical protein [Candidatus Sulfotelmatobacter sp.]
MGQNLRDLKTTIPGILVILLMLGLNILKAERPELDKPIDEANGGIMLLAGGGLIFGARTAEKP